VIRRLLCGTLLLAAVGCGKDESLHLYCGAGIRPAVDEVVQAFTAETGMKITTDYAGSGMLLSRIKASGRGDLYMPGDVHYVQQAQEMGLSKDPTSVCYFVPVILVPKGNPKQVRTLKDLLRDDIKIGLGDPRACAVGRLTERILKKNSIDADAILSRAVTFVTVNELGLNVSLGTLDATVVWDATAAQYPDATEVVAIPIAQNIISEVGIGILNTSADSQGARAFINFVTGPKGRAIFKKHHYRIDPPQ